MILLGQKSGPLFQYKYLLSRDRVFHYEDNTIIMSYLYNGNSHIGKTMSLKFPWSISWIFFFFKLHLIIFLIIIVPKGSIDQSAFVQMWPVQHQSNVTDVLCHIASSDQDELINYHLCVLWDIKMHAYTYIVKPAKVKTRTTRTPAFWWYPRRLMITHTIESYWIPSQKKTK